MIAAETLRPVTNAELGRVLGAPLPNLDGSVSVAKAVNLPLAQRMEIAGMCQFLRENAPLPETAAGRWYSYLHIKREAAHWINTRYFPGDDGIPRAGVSETAFILTALLDGYQIRYGGVIEGVGVYPCLFLSFTSEYERSRRERLHIRADLHYHIFGG
jgi:hypothetical protein